MPSAVHARARDLRRLLPDSATLDEADWRVRHTVASWVLVLHVVAVLAYGAIAGTLDVENAGRAVFAIGMLVVAVRARGRRAASIGVALGLLTCVNAFVEMSGDVSAWHFHYFVVLALIALYQEWWVFLIAGLSVMYGEFEQDGLAHLGEIVGHAAFVLAASACHIATWRFSEVAHRRAERFRRALDDGEDSVRARLEQTAQIRSDLIATASHEFRTPLTAIRGTTATLRRHADRLTPEIRDELLATIDDRTDRLAGLLESMLIAAEVEPAEPVPSTLADAVDGFQVAASVSPLTEVLCAPRPLRQLIGRVVDCVRLKAGPAANVVVRSEPMGDQVSIEVSARVAGLEADSLVGIFDPFRGGTDRTPRAADVGVGLYAARRIAEVNGGSVSARADAERLVIEIRLPRAPAVPEQPRRPGSDAVRMGARSVG